MRLVREIRVHEIRKIRGARCDNTSVRDAFGMEIELQHSSQRAGLRASASEHGAEHAGEGERDDTLHGTASV